LSWFELADKDASSKITVRNLLNQTTGISTKDGNRFRTSLQGLEEVVRGLDTIQPTQPVGRTYQYSNLNYMIAGLIVEKVSGQSYADYVTQHIFEPLDMLHSYASRAPALADGLAEGHIYMFGRVFRDEGTVPPAELPDGFLIASVEDMTHYAIAQLNDGRYGATSILSPEGIAELHAPAIPENEGDKYYAMGWNVSTVDGIPLVFHPGDAGRNHSIVMLMPDRSSGFVLLANASGFEQIAQVDDIAVGLFLMLNGKPAAPVSLPFGQSFLYWSVLLIPLLQILAIVLGWRNRKRRGIWLVLLTVILNLAVVYFLVGFSQKTITLPSMVTVFPDVGYSLIAIATLGIGWSVIYTAIYLMERRAK
jgi:CubicO group peptidase (beta-lactamase class C family)